MPKTWKILRWEGNDAASLGELPGKMTESEVETVLQRLVCSDLTAAEILAASRRKGDDGYSVLLERNGSGRPLSFGENPHYTAEIKE
jgi:hypothetical protein